ncbi:helix-turn-helix transcriptional regulator [Hydrocarboniphaga effusa]|jgi:DNA-binding CsgD family transcriptional regulator|uniref:helix-turn-helix transcriptional regulator n=1 Tax=Hydrocarboniphaga effusa TaxID=243629 RepID=UPI0035AF1743
MSLMTSADIQAQARGLLARDRVGQAVRLALDHGLDDLAAELLAHGWVGMVCGAAEFEGFFEAIERIGSQRYRHWPQLEAASIYALTMQLHLRIAALRLDELEQRVPALLRENRSFLVEHQRAPFDRPDPRDGMYSWIAMMRVAQAAFGGHSEQTLQLAADWRTRFARAPDHEFATVAVNEALALSMLDRTREAEREALAALRIFRRVRFEHGMVSAAVCAGCMKALSGRVNDAAALLDAAFDEAAPRLAQAPETRASLDVARNFTAFERGDIEAALADAMDRIEGRRPSPRLPVMLLIDRFVAARALMALGRAHQAAALLARPDLERPAGDWRFWDQLLTLERVRVAAVSGDYSGIDGPPDVLALLKLLTLAQRNPSAIALAALRKMVREAEDRQQESRLFMALLMKARVEQHTGNSLQARRSVTRLITAPMLRERLGSLASLAPALQPMFGDALRGLLEASGNRDERLLRLARLTGVAVEAAAEAGAPAEPLSPREEQIGAALLEGLSNRQIAQRIHLSEQTVRWHLWKLFQKLGVSNRLGAAQRLSSRRAI